MIKVAIVKRQLLIVNFLCLLFFCLPFPATAQAEDVPRSINESTMVGIGGYNLRDTYLSPSTDINYTGWVARVLNERMKIVRLADYNVSRQQLINVEFGSTRNGAETANEYASARLSGGFIYNTRNSNNPVSGKADFDLNLSAMAIYNFRIKGFPLTLRYQAEIPFAGVLFSVHKGEPYYFLTQGSKDGIVRFSSFHNKFAMKNYFTFDISVSSFTVRVGYLNSMYRTDVNSIKTHVLSNSFMIGLVKEFVSFGGKRLKSERYRYKSAYY